MIAYGGGLPPTYPLTESGDVGYTRDRSFYASRPSDLYTPRIHRLSVTRTGMAMCDTRFILLDTERPIPLLDDAAQKLRWCLRCFPPGSHVRTSSEQESDAL